MRSSLARGLGSIGGKVLLRQQRVHEACQASRRLSSSLLRHLRADELRAARAASLRAQRSQRLRVRRALIATCAAENDVSC
jgi:hypothetical protein